MVKRWQENLPKMLDAVGTYTKGKIEIIIADDASQDNSLAVLNSFKKENKRKHITIKIVENKNNQGFAGNVTSAVNVATGDVFVLLNTDVIPHKNFLAPLLKHFEDTKVFAVGCMDESIENEKTILRGRGVGKWTKGFLFHSAGSLNKDNNLWAAGGAAHLTSKFGITLVDLTNYIIHSIGKISIYHTVRKKKDTTFCLKRKVLLFTNIVLEQFKQTYRKTK